MLDLSNFAPTTHGDVQVFYGTATATNVGWQIWNKPRGDTMCFMFCVAAGGGGGNGTVGAASTAAGGGGGGSGAQSMITLPMMFLPDTLYLSIGRGNPPNATTSVAAGVGTRVCIAPTSTSIDCVFAANPGGSGAAATGATAGSGGNTGLAMSLVTAPLGGMSNYDFLSGQGGVAGGTTIAGAALTLPVTGIVVTGGTGGGGLPAANNAGSAGGLITAVAGSVSIPSNIPGGTGGTTAPTAGGSGQQGIHPYKNLFFGTGGTGGGSSGLSVTPTGSNGGNGGKGAPGCGGGGGGGAFTGSTAGIGGYGGDGFVVIVSW